MSVERTRVWRLAIEELKRGRRIEAVFQVLSTAMGHKRVKMECVEGVSRTHDEGSSKCQFAQSPLQPMSEMTGVAEDQGWAVEMGY